MELFFFQYRNYRSVIKLDQSLMKIGFKALKCQYSIIFKVLVKNQDVIKLMP